MVEGAAGKEKVGLRREGRGGNSVQDEVEGGGKEEEVDGSDGYEYEEGEDVDGGEEYEEVEEGVGDDVVDEDGRRGEGIVVEVLHISFKRKPASSSRFSVVVLLPTDCSSALVYFFIWILALSVDMKTVLGRGCGFLDLEMDRTGCMSFFV